MPHYDIAIIMVSHNDLDPECLRSIQREIDTTKQQVKLVVVDNASSDYRANEFVHQYVKDAIIILRNGDFGFGSSCNSGANEIEASYYFFLNPDTVLIEPNTLDRLYNFSQQYLKAGILGPKILYPDESLQETCRRFPIWLMPILQRTFLKNTRFGRVYADKFLLHDYDHKDLQMVDWVQGSAMFIPGSLWKELSGFDKRFWMYFEDIDLCRRSWEKGRPVYYLPDIIIQHAYHKESAKEKTVIKNIFKDKMARAHIASWLKYLFKWGIK